jgi:N-terminal region of Chorein or VPS13/Vacuolar sorting-associated protein 13, N-terminal
MEEVFGEYILNISKEKLRIAAMKGEIKLDDVQLDGDLVGSHFFGMFGLSNFGVLSCSAKSIRISVPWKQLEKEPTRFEVDGVHLVCVPLTPTTANQIYGSGTSVDPRCSLRTRAKRLTLARYERNFWNGLIPGEGPPLKRVTRAVKDVEREMKLNRKRNGKQSKSCRHESVGSVSSLSLSGSQHSTKSTMSTPAEYAEMEEALDDLVFSMAEDTQQNKISQGEDENSTHDATTNEDDDLPNLPRDWKVKIREKAMRNLEASITNVHIRCEVPQPFYMEADIREEGHNVAGKHAEDRAFAFGFTLESLIVRTANENWEVGSHDTKNPVDGSAMSSIKDHLGPNEYVVSNNKIGYFNKISIYWDDDPAALLAETDVLQGNNLAVPSGNINSKIIEAMDALFHKQEPGPFIRMSLSLPASQ